MDVMTYMISFGLAAGAGSRACMVIFLLGAFHHHAEDFHLDPNYIWIAAPSVMLITGFFALLNIIADAYPNISEINDWAQYFPGLVAGFLSFAAVTGNLNEDLLHLVASGVLGGALSTGVRYVRNEIAETSREFSDSIGLGTPHATRAFLETGVAVSSIVLAILVPVFAVLSIVVTIGGLFLLKRHVDQQKLDSISKEAETLEE